MCLDVPYPPDYGGVFDLFYKIKYLYEEGVKIHLHCFEYGRGKQYELDQYCVEVHYYPRMAILRSISLRLPYIVISRKNRALLSNLQKNDYPILLEGIHCTYHLYKDELKGRSVFVRLHNVEWRYYARLAINETAIAKKLYFTMESRLLRSYEKEIAQKATFLAVSRHDAETYIDEAGANRIDYLPVFLPFKNVTSLSGRGAYCLYQGNLSVPENEKAAIWLIENIFSSLEIPLIIAGKSPSRKLKSATLKNKIVSLISNPSEPEMNDLIIHAQLHVLPSFNNTGIKIKLLQALFKGRHCVVNPPAVDGTGLEHLCNVVVGVEAFRTIVKELFDIPFDQGNIEQRKIYLEKEFDNKANARQLVRWLW